MSVSSQVISGLRWTAAAKLSAQIVSWILTIYVVRLLHPSDYGLMSMAMVSISFLSLLNELGLGAALVQRREVDADLLHHAYSLLILVGLALCLTLVACAPLLASFFQDPRLVTVVRVLAVQFLITPFEIIPNALLLRKMEFKKISIIDLITRVISSLIAFDLAVNGYGVYALIFASLATVVLRVIAFNAVCPFVKIPVFSRKAMDSVWSFGGLVTLDSILWFLYSKADVFIIGKVLSTQLLGFYTVAMHLASLPMQKFNAIISQISFPAFSVIQQDPLRVTSYFKKAIRMLNLLSFPVFFGIASIAPDAVPILLGNQWQQAVLPMICLSMVMPILMTSYLFPAVLRGLGRADISVVNLAVACAIMPAAFYIGSGWGLVGISVAWMLGYPVVFLIEIIRSRVVTGLGVRDVFGEMIKPACGSLIMYICIFLLRRSLSVDPSVFTLLVEVLTGAAIFIFSITLIDGKSLREGYSLIRS